MRTKDIIYVQGGNTFYLLKYARKSGFDEVVKDVIKKGVIYIGVSAGSIIAGPSIEIFFDKNIVNVEDLRGLNLIPFAIAPHFREDKRECLRQEAVSFFYPVRVLTDDQALLIRDGAVTLVGKGKEISI